MRREILKVLGDVHVTEREGAIDFQKVGVRDRSST